MKKWLVIVLILGVLAAVLTSSLNAVFAESKEDYIASTEPKISDDEIVQQVKELVDRWSVPILEGAGWLHVVEIHERGFSDVGKLPNGQPIPIDYIHDAWYLLDPEGKVVKAIVLMKDMGGQVVQETVFNERKWFNLTTDEVMEREPFALRLDFGFSDDIARGQERYSALTSSEVTVDGKSILTVCALDDFGEALQLEGMTKAIVRTESRAYFDQASGALLLLELIGIEADGEEHKILETSFLTLERGEPSADVLELLDEVSQ